VVRSSIQRCAVRNQGGRFWTTPDAASIALGELQVVLDVEGQKIQQELKT